MSRNAQNKIDNLQTKLELFTDHKKSHKKYQSVGILLFVNDNTKALKQKCCLRFRNMSQICYAIYRPKSYKLLVYQKS